jgi:hypothetical protein
MPNNPMEEAMNNVEWQPAGEVLPPDNGTPYETHRGVLRIGSLSLDVVRISTGEALITEESMKRFFEWLESGEALSL